MACLVFLGLMKRIKGSQLCLTGSGNHPVFDVPDLSDDADMIFVKCFTPAHFAKYMNLPEKIHLNRDISVSKNGI